LLSITGIGIVNAVMLIICSNNFQGITNARSFACYCGVAPFEYSSGTSVRGKTRVSNLANKKMKANLTNAARSAVVHNNELRIYYKRKREEGKAHGTVMNAVKFKIISRAFAVIKRQTPFVKIRQAG
jgi:transposase